MGEETMSEVLGEGQVGVFHYTLTDDDGNVIDSSSGGAPMAYMHGHHNIVPGLESQMEGKAVGDTFDAEVAPADAYGELSGPGPTAVSKSEFPSDVNLQVGMAFHAEGNDGTPMALFITDIQGDQVFVDMNHPLAGKTLHFAVEVVEVRPATDDEKTHGHAHGPGGHHH
jgi:FKBP-type peptidyl-prolyl cis-trans isomerase SlyD